MSFNRIISAAERAKPQTATFYHVERIFGYRAFYLMHIEGNPDMQWTPDDDQAFRYEDREEADRDAVIYDGDVSTFDVPIWRGHNAASRLEHQYELGALASASSSLISCVRSSEGVVSEIAGEVPAASTNISRPRYGLVRELVRGADMQPAE